MAARRQLTALHPAYVRLLVDWAALQPDPARPPALAAPVSGCARAVGPCGPYAGVAAQLAAVATQQRAERAQGRAGFAVVIDILGAPAWAAQPAHGCERPGTSALARPLRPSALAAYRALIASLLALGAREGVQLQWWSPWNEPNDPRFISPQRAQCAADAAALSPGVYAQLARAMAAQLREAGGERHLLLGELAGALVDSPHRTSIASFVAALPEDVVCLSRQWSVHAYATYAPAAAPAAALGAAAGDPVAALERALAARGGCAAGAHIWVTEAGAGAPHPGRPRPPGPGGERAGCEALAARLAAWSADPRVAAVFQYSFREDPAFPVGLVSADLAHLYPSYRLWLSWSGAPARAGKAAASSLAGACA